LHYKAIKNETWRFELFNKMSEMTEGIALAQMNYVPIHEGPVLVGTAVYTVIKNKQAFDQNIITL
jgi:hypothetical protein